MAGHRARLIPPTNLIVHSPLTPVREPSLVEEGVELLGCEVVKIVGNGYELCLPIPIEKDHVGRNRPLGRGHVANARSRHLLWAVIILGLEGAGGHGPVHRPLKQANGIQTRTCEGIEHTLGGIPNPTPDFL